MKSVTKDEFYNFAPWIKDGVKRIFPNPKVGKVYRSPAGSIPGVGSTINVVEVIGVETSENEFFHFTDPYIIKRLHIQEVKVVIK